MRILTGDQMGRVDRLTVERCGIPYLTLMETAGARVVETMLGVWPAETAQGRYVIVCGKGNNGGDGAVVARQLWLRKVGEVRVLLAGHLDEMRGDARVDMEIVRNLAEREPDLSFSEIDRVDDLAGWNGMGLVVVDALFGTGLSRPVTGLAAEMIGVINDLRVGGAKVVSIDLPSGSFSDRGELAEPFVRADLTVSFTAPKVGNVLAPAAGVNGRLVVARIGSPDWLIEEVVDPGELRGETTSLELIEEEWVRQWLVRSRRPITAHKGSVGNVLLVAGMAGRTGAAALAAGSVLRSGAGLVTVATPSSALPLLVSQADDEVMTFPLPETSSGGIGMAGHSVLAELAASRDLLAIGPGISSTEEETRRLVRALVATRYGPLVIDADGLNSLAPWPVDLQGSAEAPIVITPHPGEMARLMGVSIATVQADRIASAREMARRNSLIVVLKGARTIIAEPTGRVFVNPTGNEGMATAGSGDVLTGLLAGLLAQRPEPAVEAVIAGVWLHGQAGDLAASQLGKRFMLASHIRDYLGESMRITGGEAEAGESRR